MYVANARSLWDVRLTEWADEGAFALRIVTVFGVLAAAQYLHSLGAPLSVARFFLLGM